MVNPEYWEKLEDGLEFLIEQQKLEGKDIFLLPADEYAVKVIEFLKEKHIKIKAILDNREELLGNTLCDIPIKTVETELYPFYQDRQLVLATSYWNVSLIAKLDFIECWHDINRFLLSETRALQRQRQKRSFHLKEMIKNSELLNIFRIQRICKKAERLLVELTHDYEADQAYLFPHKSIGDIYILGIFLTQSCQKFRDEFLLIVVGTACKKIAERSGFKCVVSVEQNEMDMLIQLKLIVGGAVPNLEVLHYDYAGRNICTQIFDRNMFTFFQCYQHIVFEPITRLSSYSILKAGENIVEFCKANGIIEGKSVILAPNCKSIPDVSPVLWEALTKELKKRGLAVFSNFGSQNEQNVYGAVPLSIPLEGFPQVVEYCGFFIGVRSGLCDVASGCKARKIIIFPELKGINNSIANFYTFKEMETEYPIDEIECERVPDIASTVEKIMIMLD